MLSGFINSGSDSEILKSLLREDSPLVNREELEKSANLAGLVLMPVQVHTKNGSFQAMRWVKASDVPKGKPSYKNLSEVKETLTKLQPELDNQLNATDTVEKVYRAFKDEVESSKGKSKEAVLSSLETITSMLDNVPRTLKVDNLNKIKAALDELKGTVESMGEYEKDALQEQIGKVQHEFQVQQDTNYVINDELSKQKASLEAGF